MVGTLDTLGSKFDFNEIKLPSRVFRIETLIKRVFDSGGDNLSSYIENLFMVKDGLLTFVYYDEHNIQKTFHMLLSPKNIGKGTREAGLVSLELTKDEPLSLLKDFLGKYVYIDLGERYRLLISGKISVTMQNGIAKFYFFIDDLHTKRTDRITLIPEKILIDESLDMISEQKIIRGEISYGDGIPFMIRDVSDGGIGFYVDLSKLSARDLEIFRDYNGKLNLCIKGIKPFKLFIETTHRRELLSGDKKYLIIGGRFVRTTDDELQGFKDYIKIKFSNS